MTKVSVILRAVTFAQSKLHWQNALCPLNCYRSINGGTPAKSELTELHLLLWRRLIFGVSCWFIISFIRGLVVNEEQGRNGSRVFCAQFDRNPKWKQPHNVAMPRPTAAPPTWIDTEPDQTVPLPYPMDEEDDDTSTDFDIRMLNVSWCRILFSLASLLPLTLLDGQTILFRGELIDTQVETFPKDSGHQFFTG